MSSRAFRLLGVVAVSVFLWYLMGSNSMQSGTVISPTPPISGFLVANLSILPEEVRPKELVTITVSVANTHQTWGIYNLVLKINGVQEAEKQVFIDADNSQDVSFNVIRETPGSYTVFINGLSGSFTVLAPAPVLQEVTREVEVTKEVEVIKEVPIKLQHFDTIQELEGWLKLVDRRIRLVANSDCVI